MKAMAVTVGIAGLSILLRASASPSLDFRIFGMIPDGAEVVASVASVVSGQQASYLVMTVNNRTDLTDFLSITGADPLRVIGRVVMVTSSSPRGAHHEHSLLASGQFDFRHIVKSALENGARNGEYRGTPVLILQPLERNYAISRDVRWLTVIDSKIVVFGSTPAVQQELDRYLDAAQPDRILAWRLSRLRQEDQSWCVLASFVRRIELVRRSLALLDPGLADPDRANDALVLGIHFGRNVEIEYENEPDSPDPGQFATSSSAGDDRQPALPGPVSKLRGADEMDYHTIKVSRKQYDTWIARQGPPGEPPMGDDQLARKKSSRAGKDASEK
jgi:hypothetical protein